MAEESKAPPADLAAPRPPRRRLRRAALWLAGLALLPVLVLAIALLALELSASRQALLRHAIAYLERELGIALAAEELELSPLSGAVELRQARLGAPGVPPLATAERVRARIDLGSLRRPTLVVRSLEIDAPAIDLSAPFPELPEQPDQAGEPGFEIRRLTIRRGSLAGPPPGPPASEWLSHWSAAGIEARGGFRDGLWDVTVEKATARVERPGFTPLDLALAGRVAYRDGEPVRFQGVRATGPGLELAASGSAGLEPGAPTAVTFEAAAEPRVLVAGAGPGGRIEASGDLRLPAGEGRVRIAARDVPAEALRSFMAEDLFARLSLAGTAADARASATLGPGSLSRVAGEGEATWRRGPRRLASLSAQVAPGPAVRIAFDGDLLPGSPGRRKVQGAIVSSSCADLGAATVEDLRADLRAPDVATALAEVRSLWPRLVPALPPDLPLRGSLAADARLSGPLADPAGDLRATWLPEPGSRVRVEASGRPLARTGTVTATAEALPLGLFAPWTGGLAGALSGRAELAGGPDRYRTRASFDASGLALPPRLQGVESARIEAEGTLASSPLTFSGALALTGSGLEAQGARAAEVRLDARGSFTAAPLTWKGPVDLSASEVELPGTARTGQVTLEADLAMPAGLGSLSGSADLATDRIVLEESGLEVSDLRVQAAGDRREVRIASFSGALPEGRTFAGSGRFTPEPLLAEADLDLRLVRPVDAVPAAEVTARLRAGILELTASRVETAGGEARLAATVPLAALRQVPQLAEALADPPFPMASGPVSLSLDAPALDSGPLLAALGMTERPERVRGGIAAELELDPAAPAAGRGEVRLTGLTVETPDARVAAEGPVTLLLGEGRLVLQPVHLRVDGAGIAGAGFDLSGQADLAPAWNPFADPPEAAVTRLALDGSGTIDASLLNPGLEGGRARGALLLSATAAGRPGGDLAARVRASGPGASFFWPIPYATRVEAPEVDLALAGGTWRIERGRLRLNDGEVDLGGSYGEAGADLTARLAGVRYRLDYGLSTLLSGDLALRFPAEGTPRLAGRVVVERGVLDRDLNLDREVLDLLLAPEDLPGTAEEGALDAMVLDLTVETQQGVRIKNNVADLKAGWDSLAVAGTLAQPAIRGRIELEPGGLVYAYGQTVRIDRGALVFTGDPLSDPRIDLATTSSLQDPSIARLRGPAGSQPLDVLAGLAQERLEEKLEAQEREIETEQVLSAGLASYYGARFVGRLGESLGISGISVRPVLVFGQADPSARLTVGGDLSPHVAFALSIDLREAGRQTYILDLHGFEGLPRLVAQGFTDDFGEYGGSLQQILELGGSPALAAKDGPRLRKVVVDAPEGVSRRALRRALSLEKKEPVPEGAAFDAEVDAADFVRRRGYPDPTITAEVRPAGSGRVDLVLAVAPGPRVTFAFEGDRLPRAARREVAALYRADFYEEASLDEMETTAVQALRGRGHLDPRVEAAVAPGADPEGARRVVVRVQAGPRAELKDLEVAGVGAEEEVLLAGRFPGTLARAELAAGLPGAERRLLEGLRALGYPEARILGRALEEEGDRLVVRVEPGPRQVVAEVAIEGLDEVAGAERKRLLALVPLRPGDPPRLDRVSAGARHLEEDLRGQGFARALVRPVVRPAGERQGEVEVVYQIAAGERLELARVDFTGGRSIRAAALARAAGLERGEPYDPAAVAAARGRLFGSGLYSRVTAGVTEGPEGAVVTFSLAAKPRFRLGYGVRWESDKESSTGGASAVVDLVDGNFLGRGLTLGLRTLYEPDDQSGRLYFGTGPLLGGKTSLEAYAEARERLTSGDLPLIEQRTETALQLTRPLGRVNTFRLYGRYRRTRFTEEEPDPFFPIDLTTAHPYLGVQLLRDTRDDLFGPERGLFASADLSGSGPFVGSDFDYVRLYGQVSLFRPVARLGERPVVWAQSLRAGVARPYGGQTELLADVRFSTGGPLSVRGYELDSLAPVEEFTEIRGGEAVLVLNQELRVPLPWDLTGIAFLDAGQAWDEAGDFGTDLATALGLGLRAGTPAGLVRLDVAFPLDRRPEDEGYRFYVGFGNVF